VICDIPQQPLALQQTSHLTPFGTSFAPTKPSHMRSAPPHMTRASPGEGGCAPVHMGPETPGDVCTRSHHQACKPSRAKDRHRVCAYSICSEPSHTNHMHWHHHRELNAGWGVGKQSDVHQPQEETVYGNGCAGQVGDTVSTRVGSYGFLSSRRGQPTSTQPTTSAAIKDSQLAPGVSRLIYHEIIYSKLS